MTPVYWCSINWWLLLLLFWGFAVFAVLFRCWYRFQWLKRKEMLKSPNMVATASISTVHPLPRKNNRKHQKTTERNTTHIHSPQDACWLPWLPPYDVASLPSGSPGMSGGKQATRWLSSTSQVWKVSRLKGNAVLLFLLMFASLILVVSGAHHSLEKVRRNRSILSNRTHNTYYSAGTTSVS